VPTYQYACTACDHRFEAVQSFSDASLTECPACSGLLRKVFSSVGIVFKGSGFYRTDSRSAAGSTVPGGSEASSGGSDKGGSGSTEKSTSTSSEKSASTSSSSTTSSAPAAAAKS
jgi:putative FmdB family regulatory protein